MHSKMIGTLSPLAIFLIVAVSASCKKEKSEEASLYVSPTTLEFDEYGGSKEIQITSNTLWSVSDTSDWCITLAAAAEGSNEVVISVDTNKNVVGRTTTVFVTAEDIIREVKVNQLGLNGAPVFTYAIPPDKTDMRDISGQELALEMKTGWNIGNSLEAIGGETAWGNPLISERLIDSVKAAGFNAIRIPVAWSNFSDELSFTIEYTWLDRVEEVVNYVLDRDMYAIFNIHWDGGWMQPSYEDEDYVNDRLSSMWRQIATRFRDYDDHLLFAGTNEVHIENNWGSPTVENREVQNGFNQTFVTTVRATGGRNAYRHLVVQSYRTDINLAISYAVMPVDVVEGRLWMEVHYYDPYDFALNEGSTKWQWGEIATDPSLTAGWGDEDWADSQFQKMKTDFVDQGIPVILGEYGAISRIDFPGHEEYRTYYNEYITQSAIDHGLVPFYWDNGHTGDHSFGLFNRSTGEQVFPDIIEAITSAAN